MNDKRRRHTHVVAADVVRLGGKPGKAAAAQPSQPPVPSLTAASGARKRLQEVHCEIDGLPVELDPHELSSTGLFVETPLPAAVDSELEVFLRIGELRFCARGHVVKSVSCDAATARGKRPGYALLLTNLGETERKRLGQAIDALQLHADNENAYGSQPAAPKRPSRPAAQRAQRTQEARKTAFTPADARRSPLPPTAARVPSSVPSSAARRASMSPSGARKSPLPAPRSPVPSATQRKVSTPPHPARKSPLPVNNLQSQRASPPKPVSYSPEELQVLTQLTRELEELGPKTAWGVLGISQGADLDEAKAAFHRASKRYHPHLFARYSHPEIKRVVTELFIAHKRAYTTMLKSGKSLRASRP